MAGATPRRHVHDPGKLASMKPLLTWFLAICQDCEPILPQPFYVQAERDEWAEKHRTATGHRVELVTEHRA